MHSLLLLTRNIERPAGLIGLEVELRSSRTDGWNARVTTSATRGGHRGSAKPASPRPAHHRDDPCLTDTAHNASYTYSAGTTFGGKIGNMTTKTEGGVTANLSYSAEHTHAPSARNGGAIAYDKSGNAVNALGDIYVPTPTTASRKSTTG